MKKGKIVQVMGPVVDVEFEDDDLPYIKDALEVDNNGQKCIMEVSQHKYENYVDEIYRVYNSDICDIIDNYNCSAYYEPSYIIARAYQKGGF